MNRLVVSFSPIAIFVGCGVLFSLAALPLFLANNETNASALSFLSFTVIFLIMLFAVQKTEISIIFLLALILRYLCVVIIPTVQTSDFLIMHQAAINAANGDFAFVNDPYYQDWAYQLGFVFYQALIIWFTGSEKFVLQIINVFFTSASVVIVYLIGRDVFNKRAGIVAAFLYAFYLPVVVSSALLTNQHLATFFFISSVYVVLQIHKSPYFMGILAGLLIAFGDFFRPLGIVVLTGVSLFLLYKSWRPIVKFEFKEIVLILFVLFSYKATTETLTYAINYSGVYEGRLRNNNPKWKFVLGLNQSTTGTYSFELAKIVSAANSKEERDHIQDQIIKEHLSNKMALLTLFKDKFFNMWGSSDALIWWSLRDTGLSNSLSQLTVIEQSQYLLILSLFIFGFLLSIRKFNFKSYLMLAILSLYVGVHLLIEIQTRYRYFAMPFIIIYAGYGYTIFENFVWTVKSKILRP